jgi:hypothetical protein
MVPKIINREFLSGLLSQPRPKKRRFTVDIMHHTSAHPSTWRMIHARRRHRRALGSAGQSLLIPEEGELDVFIFDREWFPAVARVDRTAWRRCWIQTNGGSGQSH